MQIEWSVFHKDGAKSLTVYLLFTTSMFVH